MATPNFIDAVYDGGLDYIVNNVTQVDVCSAEPANYAGISAVSLGSYTVTSGDFTKANGGTDGRKVSLNAQTGNNASADGTASHLALSNGSSTLYGVVAISPTQSTNSGSPLDINASDLLTIRDAT